MALLAWTAFAFEAIAHPLMMDGSMHGMPASTAGHAMSPHCMDMMADHAAPAAVAPAHPVTKGHDQKGHDQNGHGCCGFGHCNCAASCGSVVAMPSLVMTWPPLRGPAFVPMRASLRLTAATPQLRPPIA